MGVVLVLTTVSASANAEALGDTLVTERLAACVNVLPAMRSIYRWKGELQHDDERQLVIKTSSDRLSALQARLQALHPYELPEFLVLSTDGGSEAYLNWVGVETADEPMNP
jgi:periplasmic divalent cation tolerance protein